MANVSCASAIRPDITKTCPLMRWPCESFELRLIAVSASFNAASALPW